MAKIFILTEGGDGIGMGHISRCLSLSQVLNEYGHDATMIVKGNEIPSAGFGGAEPVLFDWINKEDEVLSIVKDADLLIIDSYLCPANLYHTLASTSLLAAYIDDTVRIAYPSGVVINGVMCAEKLNYPERDGITYLLGHEYSFLRKAFWEVKDKTIRTEVGSIMIACGVHDDGLSYRILRSLIHHYPFLKINVLLKNRQTPHLSFYEAHSNILTDLDAAAMKQVMIDSDIAITASGQTTYELCRVGTPFIAMTTADNQLFSIDCFHKNGLVGEPIRSNDPELEEKILQQFNTLSDHTLRTQVHIKMKQTFNGQGSLKVIDYLLKTLKKITENDTRRN